MKVLLVFPQRDHQTGLFIKRAFVQLGAEVQVIDPQTEIQRIISVVATFNPDLLFCSRTSELLSYVRHVKRSNPNTIRMCWNVDKRNSVKEFGQPLLDLFAEMDIFYTTGKGNIAEYAQLCPGVAVKHLQQGCDPETHKKEELTEEDHKKYDCDVMFAGRWRGESHPGRKTFFTDLQKEGFNVKLYGYENHITDSEQNKACLCSKIVLGHNAWSNIDISMSVRDYKIMGCGAFLLTEHCKDIETWFELGKECDTYSSYGECVEKINYYLSHEDERKQIAATGYDIAHKKHKYLDRMRDVLVDVESYRK